MFYLVAERAVKDMDILNTVISVFLGLIPEVLYFTLFLINTKNIKEKKIRLFLLIALVYVLCIMISRYKLLYYVVFIFLIYGILKLLYKSKAQIIDIFVFGISTLYLTILSFLIYIPNNLNQYLICLVINRILLFVPFIFKNKFNILYIKYCGLWNRNYNKKNPIKSITLRNISLISINCIIFLINIICLYTTQLISK